MEDTKIPGISTSQLWFGLIGAPITWAVHFMLVWAVVEMGCGIGWGSSQLFFEINTVHGIVLTLSLIALTLISLAGFTAYRNWQQVKLGEQETSKRVLERARFMALTGMGFSLLFLLVVLYMTIPVFVLPPCNLQDLSAAMPFLNVIVV